jgi:hypothetical protein
MIALIKRGYIPNHYKEFEIYDKIQHRYVTDKNSFYLKSKSVNVNIYHKYQQLLSKYPGNPSLNESLNVIRFEVQLKRQKVQYITANIREELLKNHTMMLNLLSDEVAEMMVTDYFNRIVKHGDYYSLKNAISKIQSCNYRDKRADRLVSVLRLISKHKGISNAVNFLSEIGITVSDFNRSLQELSAVGVNPVTITAEWGVDFVLGLLGEYKRRVEKTTTPKCEKLDKIRVKFF